jgi:hypothetical protein
LVSRLPYRLLQDGDNGVSQVPGEPSVACPAASTLRRTHRCQANSASVMLPSLSTYRVGIRKGRFRSSPRSLRLRCLRFTASVTLAPQDSLPAGGHPWPDGTHTRRVRSEGFQDSVVISDSLHLFPLPQASPGAHVAPFWHPSRSLQDVAREGGNIFEELLKTVRFCSLGQISNSLYEVGGQYRRSM